MTHEQLSYNPEDPDDIGDFLKKEGIDLSALGPADDREGIPVIDGGAVFDALQTAKLPDLTTIKLSPEASARLNTPVITERDVHEARQGISRIFSQLLEDADNTPEEKRLRIDDNAVFNAVTALSEMLTNAHRYGGGARCVLIGRTALGNLFVGVPNNNLEEPSGQETTPVIVKDADGNELADNEHLRGLHLVGALSVNHLRSDHRVSAGLTLLDQEGLSELAASKFLTEEDIKNLVLRRRVAWAVFGIDMHNEDRTDLTPVNVKLAS